MNTDRNSGRNSGRDNTFALSKQETNQGSLVVSIGIAAEFVLQLARTSST
jgi:hypothetical protein